MKAVPKHTTPDIDTIRHSTAHLLAAAVLELHPEAKLGIGPVIENGFYYDFDLPQPLSSDDLPRIEEKMRGMIENNIPFVREELPLAKAIAFFKKLKQPYKVELLQELKKKGTTRINEEEAQDVDPAALSTVNIYHTGDFVDLCRGPHVASTGEIPKDAFALTRLAGAYWRGSEKNPQLTRVYGVAFLSKKELGDYLWKEEEAKKRDHRVLGQKLKLFTFVPEVGPGLPLWLPHGAQLRETIEHFAKDVERAWGYERIVTPHIAKEELYKTSGHIPYYAASMFPPMKLDDGTYYVKAMNCPHTHLIYKHEPHSYRELPIRYAEYGTVYRYELSGTLAGLLRTRGFTQNDAHIYCTFEQAEDEFLRVMRLHEFWYKEVFCIEDFYMRLSLPSLDKKKYALLGQQWDTAVKLIRGAMEKSRLSYVEAVDEAAFYGPKVDFQIKSVIGREETASTNQLDFVAAERFHLIYRDKDGADKPVWVIHRAPLGSHERFIAFLIEHYAGAFPFWLSPVQVGIVPVASRHIAHAQHMQKELEEKGIRAEILDANETVGKKIRELEMRKVPLIGIMGDVEKQHGTLRVRERSKGDRGEMNAEGIHTLLVRPAIKTYESLSQSA